MKRALTIPLICFLVPLLLGAKVLPTTLEPSVPTFGKVVTIRIELPNGVTPGGLPTLDPFIPLAAPTVTGNEYRLELLPVRSGTFTLPSLPFQRGYSERFHTAPVPIEIIDDIPLDAKIIPPTQPTRKASQRPGVIFSLTIVTLGIVTLAVYTRRRLPTLTAPALNDYSGNELLAELDRRIAADTERPAEERRQWRERLDAARFSHPAARDSAARQLLAVYLQQAGGDT